MLSKIKLFLVKNYFSIIGFLIKRKLSHKKLVLIKDFSNSEGLVLKTYKPLEKRYFKVNTQCCEKTSGTVMFNEKTEELKYWALGVLYNNKEFKISSEWKNF
jgi:hypothetical protein